MMLSRTVVFWDFDGTLATRAGGWWGGALYDALRDRSPDTDVTREMLTPHLQTGFPWHDPDKPHLHLCDPAEWWRYMEALLARALVNVGIGESEAAVCAREVRGRYLNPSRWTVYDDAVPALTTMRGLGVRNIILSNHVPELEWLVGKLGFGAHLDGVITSALIGYEKPNQKVYEIALETAGYPASAYMVGDNPVADVAGPEAVGIRGILISRRGDGEGERVVSSLLDVASLVRLGA